MGPDSAISDQEGGFDKTYGLSMIQTGVIDPLQAVQDPILKPTAFQDST